MYLTLTQWMGEGRSPVVGGKGEKLALRVSQQTRAGQKQHFLLADSAESGTNIQMTTSISSRNLRKITPGQVLPKSWEVFSDSPLASPENRIYEESMRSSSGNNVRLILLATKVMYLSPGTEANLSPPLLPNKDDHIFPGGRLLHHLRRTLQLSKDELCMHKSGSADLRMKA